MSPSIDTRETRAFAREIKFLIDDATAARVRVWARAHLGPDPNAIGAWGDEYLTTSIYFDNERFDVFRQQGSHGRTKYRIRRYGESDEIYLEPKLRTPRLLSKRCTSIDLGEIARLSVAGGDADTGWAGDWFQRRMQLRGLRPVCEVS